jgi:PEP-CTERM motif-containing protein
MTNKLLRTIPGIAFLFVLIAPNAYGDPLTFSNVVALQNGGAISVNLFENPGISLTGPTISFLVDINGTLPVGGDTLRVTFVEAGQAPVIQTFNIPIFSGATLPYTQIFSVTFQNPTVLGISGTLNLDILGSTSDFIVPSGAQAGQTRDSYTYTITGTQPVPEPASILLLAAGVVGLSAQRRRGRDNTPSSS